MPEPDNNRVIQKAFFIKPFQVGIFTGMDILFTPVSWAHSTNIYEINLRQYTQEGTFNAFVNELPRLKDMGVKTLWFMPIHPIGIKNRKGTLGSYYSISNYTDVNPEFGSLMDFRSFVKKAHDLDFRVIIDWVANHTAWDNVWTETNPAFYSKNEWGNFRPPYPDWEDVIHLNYDNKELWVAMISAMKFWIDECDIDGFRCDMAHLVPLEFWKEARIQLDAVKPLFWLAETEEINYHFVFDASYTWEFLHKMEQFSRHEANIAGLESILYKYNTMFPANALRVYFTSNHDENSHSGSEYERMGETAKAFAVLCATWNGIPLIYSGQELPNKKRLKFFDKDPIDWTGNNELHDFYKTLLEIHSLNPALRAADVDVKTYRILTSSDDNVFAFLRSNGKHQVLVVLNLSSREDLYFTILDEKINGEFKNIFNQGVNTLSIHSAIKMQAYGYLVFEKIVSSP